MNQLDVMYESMKQGFVDALRKDFSREEVSRARMAICESCPSFFKLTKQCKECGCFMEVKTKLGNSKCPLGKWKEV